MWDSRVTVQNTRRGVCLCSKRLLAVGNPFHEDLASIIGLVDVVEVEDLRVPMHLLGKFQLKCQRGIIIHHDLPCVHRQIRVVKRPIELLLRFRLVGRVVVGGEVFMCKAIASADSFLGIKYQHPLQKVHRCDMVSPRFREEKRGAQKATYLRDRLS